MKKIAIVCHDHTLSGANMSMIDWMKDFKSKEYELVVVLPRRGEDMINKLKEIGINNIIISHYLIKAKIMFKMNLDKKVKEFIKYVYSKTLNPIFKHILYLKFKKENIQLIQSNSFAVYLGAELAKKMNIPHVWHIREFMEEDHQITHYNQKQIEELCNNSYAIFISDVISQKYTKKYNFIDYEIIYDKVEYYDKYNKKRKFMEDEKCNIIIVGILSENKGQMEAIKAIELLNKSKSNINLYICGTGPNEKKLKNYVKENQIENIHFLGYRKDIIDLRKKMDISLMCSENEGLGRVTLEAQYYENIIIGANCGCTPYLIKDNKTGLLYKKGSPHELSDKINWCINNKKETENIIKNAKKESIKNFSNTITGKIIKFYDKIMK